jgi:small-conductance mechanosensitive channel
MNVNVPYKIGDKITVNGREQTIKGIIFMLHKIAM